LFDSARRLFDAAQYFCQLRALSFIKIYPRVHLEEHTFAHVFQVAPAKYDNYILTVAANSATGLDTRGFQT